MYDVLATGCNIPVMQDKYFSGGAPPTIPNALETRKFKFPTLDEYGKETEVHVNDLKFAHVQAGFDVDFEEHPPDSELPIGKSRTKTYKYGDGLDYEYAKQHAWDVDKGPVPEVVLQFLNGEGFNSKGQKNVVAW